MIFHSNKRSNKAKQILRNAVEALEGRVLLAYTLDPSFSGDGIAEGAGTNLFAVQADNKIVAYLPSNTSRSIARFSTDGSLDTSFGNGGKVVLPFQPVDMDIAGGKIFVAGGGFQVARYNLNGTLDTTYGGGDGIAQAPTEHGSALTDMAVAPDGKVVIVGSGRETPDINDSSQDRAYWISARFNADGTLDNSYAGDGVSEEVVPDQHFGWLSNTGVQSDGRFIVVGSNAFSVMDGLDWWMWRTGGAEGTSDNFQMQAWHYGDTPKDLEIQSDNKILLLRDNQIVRYTADGPVDTSFNTDALAGSTVSGVQPLANGNILVAGSDAGGNFVARLLPNGNLDSTFSIGGK